MIHTPTLEFRVTAQENSGSLAAVADLFQALHLRSVRYCHWKSNLRLEQALQGRTDLDLLVDRKHSRVFRQILHELNLKPMLAPPGKRYPAIENYLGFDPPSGRLFHLHVHYQLVLGEQFVKNYRLPLEAQFLDSVRLRHRIKIPAPELEIIVLSLRALLKYRDRDVLKDLLSIRSSGLPAHILQEFDHLLQQTTIGSISTPLADLADLARGDVVQKFLETVTKSPRAGYTLYRLRLRARRALRPYQRFNRLQAALQYFRELWRRRKSFLKFLPSRNLTMSSGGVTLAVIGADGAGKSTMCQLLAKWLAWKLDVHLFYLGSKQPSRRSELLYVLFRMARRSQRAMCRVLGEDNLFSRWIAGLRDGFLYAHHLSIGQDRYRRYVAGQKKAMAGSIVIYDRYPLESISARVEHRLLDGPQIPLTAHGETAAIAGAFARAEQNLYRKIRPPDYLFLLEVSPDVSLERKPDHKRAVVEAKSRAVSELAALAELDTKKLRLIHLNADLPLDEVVSQLKTNVWEVL